MVPRDPLIFSLFSRQLLTPKGGRGPPILCQEISFVHPFVIGALVLKQIDVFRITLSDRMQLPVSERSFIL